MLKELEEGILQQYVYNENDNEVSVGISLKTVDDLMKRYKSMSGHQLKYWDKGSPQNGQ